MRSTAGTVRLRASSRQLKTLLGRVLKTSPGMFGNHEDEIRRPTIRVRTVARSPVRKLVRDTIRHVQDGVLSTPFVSTILTSEMRAPRE